VSSNLNCPKASTNRAFGDDAVPPSLRQSARKHLEASAPVRAAIAQCRREHRQLVFVGEQRSGHIATVVVRRDRDAPAILKHMVTRAKTRPGTREERDEATVEATDTPWVTIVLGRPVNLMTYVTYVLRKLFGYSEPHATKLMLQVTTRARPW